MEGALIVIEGGDSSGKATQIARLYNRLSHEGKKVQQLDFPRYTDNTFGKLLRECLDGDRGDFMSLDARIASTLYAADRFESRGHINTWLQNGDVVLLDRYTSANMLHQGAKIADPAERKEMVQWIYQVEHEIFSLPIPDIVFFLDVPAEVRTELQKGKGRAMDVAEVYLLHQQQVDERADSIFSIYKNTHKIECMRDGQLRSIEDIGEEVYNHIKEII